MSKCFSPILTPGRILDTKQEQQQLFIQTESAFLEIEAYSSSVIRVRMNKSAFGRDFSYAVVGSKQPCKTSFSEDDKVLEFSTASVKTVIQKDTCAISFYSLDGQLINEDERELNTSWIGDTVTTYKTLQEGERFIGLGEKTGDLDRKGAGYTHWNKDAYGYGIEQDPIYSTIPFYIGVHHGLNYGIFFDNSFQSDFKFLSI